MEYLIVIGQYLSQSCAHLPLGLAACRQSHVALLVNKDGETEGGSLHSPAGEPELVTNSQESPEHLQSVASSWLLMYSHLNKNITIFTE